MAETEMWHTTPIAYDIYHVTPCNDLKEHRESIDAQRPKMSDFKGSSAIEMAANIVLLWTLQQDADVDNARHGELWIEAGRNVAYDEFTIKFYGAKALFTFAD